MWRIALKSAEPSKAFRGSTFAREYPGCGFQMLLPRRCWHTQGLRYNVYGLFDQKAEAPGDLGATFQDDCFAP